MAANSNESSVMDTVFVADIYDSDGLRLGIFSSRFETAAMCLYIFIGLLGILLNSCTIWVVIGSKKTKFCKLQMINLAVANMLSGILMPIYLIYHTLILPFPDSNVLAKLLCFSGYAVFYAGPLCNIAISFERFFAVYFPFRMLNYGPRQKVIVMILVWVAALSCSLEGLIWGKIKYFKESIYGSQVPMPLCHYSFVNQMVYTTVMVLKYTLPAVIISVMYLLIIIKLCQRPNIQQTSSARHDTVHKKERQKRQVVKMLAIYAFVTIITWVPFEVLCAYGADHDKRYIALTVFLVALQLTTCFTAPVIYYTFNDALRAEYHRQARKVCSLALKKSISSTSYNIKHLTMTATSIIVISSQKRASPMPSLNGGSTEPAQSFAIATISS